MKWADSLDIAIALCDAHPTVDPRYVRYTDMHAWVCALPEFADASNKSNERMLEAIQMAWIEEAAD